MSSTDRILSINPRGYGRVQWNETESANASEIAEVILQCAMRRNFFFRLNNENAGTDLQCYHLQSLGPTLLVLAPHSHRYHGQRSPDPLLSGTRSSR